MNRIASAASPPRLDLGQWGNIVVGHTRLKLRIRGRETAKKLERGTSGLELGFDRAERLPGLPVGWSHDRWRIGIKEGAGLAIGREKAGRPREESLVR